MDRSKTFTLIKDTFTVDSIGQKVPTETERQCFCAIESVTQNEWNIAGQNGHNPEYRVTMFAPDYEEEEKAKIGNVRYGIYRTFQKKNGDEIELYLERKSGV